MNPSRPLILRTGDPERPWVVKIDDKTIGYIKPRLIHQAIMPDGAIADQNFNGRYPAADYLKAIHEMAGSWYIALTIPGRNETLYLFTGRETGPSGGPVPARWQADEKICKKFRSNEGARQYARDHLHGDDLSGGQLSFEWSSQYPHLTTKARIKPGVAESGAKVYHVIDAETDEDLLDGEGFADEMDAATYIQESEWEQVD